MLDIDILVRPVDWDERWTEVKELICTITQTILIVQISYQYSATSHWVLVELYSVHVLFAGFYTNNVYFIVSFPVFSFFGNILKVFFVIFFLVC